MSAYLKCPCEYCASRIEFPAEAVGATVSCPHCQQMTLLRIITGTEDDGVGFGGPRWKLAVGTLITCALLAAALAIAPSILRRLKPGMRQGSAGGGGAGGAGQVDLDPPRPVTPAIGKFQNGLSAQQIRPGRELFGYANACTECHRQYDPATYGNSEWDQTISSMRGKAKLNQRQFDDLNSFVRSVRP